MNTELIPLTDEMGDPQRLETINNNFHTLTERLAKLNTQYQYLDLIRITHVFYTEETDQSTIASEFIAKTWVTLDNYSGAYIQLPANCSFVFEKETYQNGDFILKLPGNAAIHILGPRGTTYYPQWTPTKPFKIKYIADDEGSGPTVPTEIDSSLQNTNLTQVTGAYTAGTAPTFPGPLYSIRWFIGSGTTSDTYTIAATVGEEILFNQSYDTVNIAVLDTVRSATAHEIEYRAIYYSSPSES